MRALRDPNEAIDALQTKTGEFLQHNLLNISTSGHQVDALYSGLAIFKIYRKGAAKDASNRPVSVWSVNYERPCIPEDRLNTDLTATSNCGYEEPAAELMAYYIAMKDRTAVKQQTAHTHYLLPHKGIALMLTCELLGCTFGIGSQTCGSGVICSHIRSDAGIRNLDEYTRRSKMRKTALKFMGGSGRVYEQQHKAPAESTTSYCIRSSIIGKREADQFWHFWSQKQKGNGSDLIMERVHEI